MNIDWDCRAAEGCDWALLNAEIGMIHFYRYRPSNNGISWNCKGVSGEPSYKHYTLHERPEVKQVNIDWNCEKAKGKDYCFVNNLSCAMVFQNYAIPPSNAAMWTLHERPKAEQMKETIYTKEMHEAGEECEVGMKFQSNSGYIYTKLLPVDARGLIVVSHNGEYSLFALSSGINPIDTRTDKEKAIDDINYVLMNEVAGKTTRQIAEHIVNKIEYLTFTGDK